MIDLERWAEEYNQNIFVNNKEHVKIASVIFDKVVLQDAVNALSTKLKTLQTTLDETIANKLSDHDKTNVTRSPMDLTLNGEGTTSRPYLDLV